MHIAFVSHSAELQGAEQSMLPLVELAGDTGHRVTVFVPRKGPLVEALRDLGCAVVVLRSYLWIGQRHTRLVGAVRLAQALMMVPAYVVALARHRPDVVVTNSVVVPTGALAARLLRLRHVWLVQESLLTNPSLNSVLPTRVITRLVGALSERVVAVSTYVADQLTTAGATYPVSVSPPAVLDSALLRNRPVPRSRRALERLLLLGSFSADKGHLDAVDALRTCRDGGLRLELRLLGTGTASSTTVLRRAVTHAGLDDSVSVEGWADDPSSAYAWADALLMLSRNEAFGRVTVEALSFGLPVVGYAAGATTELVADGGGELVPAGAENLAALLTGLAGDHARYRRLAAEATRRSAELDGFAGAGAGTLALITGATAEAAAPR